MLSVEYISSPQEKEEHLNSFDVQTQSWLVPDLQTKIEVQNRLLPRYGGLEESCILRASEFWRQLFFKIHPEVQLVSADLIQTYMNQWLEIQDMPWARTPGAARTLYQYTSAFLPVLASDDSSYLMTSWLNEASQNQMMLRWGVWYQTARSFWHKFKDNRLTTEEWTSAWLISEDLSPLWNRDLIVDLGSELSLVESELLQKLAKHCNVKVLCPKSSWQELYSSQMRGYSNLSGESQEIFQGSGKIHAINQDFVSFHRYSTQLAEVKAAVHHVRSWLDSGVELENIAILAPDIETYWACLYQYLKTEGIPANKPRVVRLQSFPKVYRWLARLRVNSGQMAYADLESLHYNAENCFSVSYDKFKSLLSLFYSEKSLEHLNELQELYQQRKQAHDHLSRDAFIVWIMSHWPADASRELFDKILSRMHEVPAHTDLKLQSWIEYLEKICSRIEHKLEVGYPKGIQVNNIKSGEWMLVSHVFVLGVSDDGLREQSSTSLQVSDIERIYQDIGLPVEITESAKTEMQLRWFLEKPMTSVILSAPETDFSGGILAPSVAWLISAQAREEEVTQTCSPGETRWDEGQKDPNQFVGQERGWSEEYLNRVRNLLQRDIGLQSFAALSSVEVTSLSASQIELYDRCPFQFAAERLFRLSDLPNLDLDVDHMSKGSFIHQLFFHLLEPPINWSPSDAELDGVLERCRKEIDLKVYDQALWQSMKARHRAIARRFLDEEKKWREEHPDLNTVARELAFVASLDPETGRIEKESQGLIRFRGQIDRVDQNSQGHYSVVDYKSGSKSNLPNHGSWIKGGHFQLSLYSEAIERGATPLAEGPVDSSLYFSVKDMDRSKGFVSEDIDKDFGEVTSPRGHKLSREKFEQLRSDINQRVRSIVGEILVGHIEPRPRDLKFCDKCAWRNACRAPHLN